LTLTDNDRQRLASFRAAAGQVRDASIIAQGQVITIEGRHDGSGQIQAVVTLLGNEAFRSLALAERLAYQQGEPAHFMTVANIVAREGNSEVRDRIAGLREDYKGALRNPAGAIVVHTEQSHDIFTAQQIFEHWMYGIAFHQDADRQASVQLLASTGPAFPLSVQSTGLLIAGRILDLDDAVADLLGEPRLPRI